MTLQKTLVGEKSTASGRIQGVLWTIGLEGKWTKSQFHYCFYRSYPISGTSRHLS